MTDSLPKKMIRRLAAAEGFLELDLPRYALEELDAIDDANRLEGPMMYLRGEALKALAQYDNAIEPLSRAAELFPPQLSKFAWMSLSDCYRETGKEELADMAQQAARALADVVAPPTLQVDLQFPLQFDVDFGDSRRSLPPEGEL